MTSANALDSVYFLKLPDNFKFSEAAFPVDVTVPIPVQKKDSDAAGNFSPEEITEEQILAGILTVLAHDRHNAHTNYYRSIVQKLRPKIKQELTEAAILKAKNEDYEIAEEIFSALRGLDPDDMATVLNTALFLDERASSYRRAGLIEDADAYDNDALSFYMSAMDADPPLPDAFFNAGFFYLKQNKYAEAKDCFESYVAFTCDASDEELGETGLYKKERAQEILNEIKSQNTDDARFSDAYKLISNGEEEKGIEQIREFLQHNPKVWNAWFMLGWGLRKIARYDDARSAFVQSLACEGGESNVDTYNELAICHMEAGNFDEAKKNLMHALSLAPENTKILSNLGCLAMKSGNTDEASKYFMTVLEFSPNDVIALSQLKEIERMS